MKDIERIDANIAILDILFQQPDDQILKTHKMKDLSDLFAKVYGYAMPSNIGTKANALKQLRRYYQSVMRADALRAAGKRYH